MGSSAPKSETVVKGGKPTIVREYLSPEYLKTLGNLSEYYGNRALQERSTYQDVVNRTMSNYGRAPLYDPMQTTTGQIIAPGQVSAPYETSNLIKAAQEGGMFKPPKMPESTKSKKEVQKESRNSYLGALMKRTSPDTDLGR